MAFSLDEFSGKVSRYGLSKNNLFHVRVTLPRCLDGVVDGDFYQNDLQFFCRSVDIPDITIDTAEVYHQGTGIASSRPNGFTVSPLNAVFMVDPSFESSSFSIVGCRRIYNFETDNISGETDGALPYEIGYKNDYATTITITQFSNNNTNNFYVYQFRNAFPKTIGSMGLAWESQNEILTLPVSFSYDNVIPMGLEASDGVSVRSGRSGSVIQKYLETQQLINTVSQFTKSQSIQDAIDRLTTVSNKIGKILK